MTISISQILTSVTEWIRHSSLIRNYVPLLLAWLSTGSRNASGSSDQIYMVKTQWAL